MSMQDPVSDMLTIIRNAQMIGIKKVSLPHSNFKNKILMVLKNEGFIENYDESVKDGKKYINIMLKYFHDKPVIEKITRVSRPALRVYRGFQDLPVVRGGLGLAIVSTPNGVMSDKTARAQKVGGEVLCLVE
jgi:small subunit ribosomal protein S8